MTGKRIVLAALILCFLVAASIWRSPPGPDEVTLRHLVTGDVVGYEHDNGSFAWLGIPFVSPPVGELRWRAPRPVEPWGGVLEALEHAPMCPQFIPLSWVKSLITVGEEDCLYLNVWTPRLRPNQLEQANLPVMVWIHGGANTMGGAGAADPYRFAARENVIVVSLQYRLGLLGWFSHPSLRDTAAQALDATANFALLDMVAALRWVQDNIAQFGGDPANVTMFGQSAGAFNAIALMATPQAKGLFQKVIAQSGMLNAVARSKAENYVDDEKPGLPYSSREYINGLLIADGLAGDREQAKTLQDGMDGRQLVDYLREKSVRELFLGTDRRGGLGYRTPVNIRDGIALPQESLMAVFADPARYHRVPVILGSNRDEFKLFLWLSPRFTDRRFGLLPRLRDSAEYDRVTAYFSDHWQAVGVNEPARVLQRSQPGQVFTYRFDWADQRTLAGVDMARLFGAAHGIEVTLLFGAEAVDTLPLFAVASDGESRDELGEAMLRYWADFARTGNPGGGDGSGLVRWSPWRDDGARKLLLNSSRDGGIRMTDQVVYMADLKARLRSDPAITSTRERCELYAQLFLYGFSSDFWDEEEYVQLGCADFPPRDFESII